jgi:hypothetical protein
MLAQNLPGEGLVVRDQDSHNAVPTGTDAGIRIRTVLPSEPE